MKSKKRYVYLKREMAYQYILRNDKGEQLASEMSFMSELEAMEWAKAWASSWSDVEVKLHGEEDRVSE